MNQIDLYTSEADAAYQGAPGAFSEEAAQALLGQRARLMPCATLEQTFDTVSDGRARHAVVPIEDAHSGTVPSVYELLLSHDLCATGETVINIDHVLVAPHGSRRSQVTRVLSHPIALAQCADFLRQHRHVEAVSVFDTAGAVRMTVDAKDGKTAAIASRRAAALYGADIIAEHIQDQHDNWTRFLLISPRAEDTAASAARKALIAFALRHEPGSLVRPLQVIANHGLSVTKIEGLPIDRRSAQTDPTARPSFEYRFVVEMAAVDGVIPPDVYPAIAETTTWLKVVGKF